MIVGSLLHRLNQSNTHTHRGQYNISREYYYETFKPPLSGRISIRCPTTTLTLWIFFSFCVWIQAQDENSCHTNREKSVWGFLSFATFGFVCFAVACLSHFTVWSKSPPSDSLNNAHCTTGCTHFQDFSRSGTISVVEKASTIIITIILTPRSAFFRRISRCWAKHTQTDI